MELKHHGVKGMKWGVRRYQNKDGTLTEAGKKKISKEYKKLMVKGDTALTKSYNEMYVKAHNKTAEDFNNGLTDKYNKDFEKKYGTNAYNNPKYNDGYLDLFDKVMTKNLNKNLYDFYKTNPNYQSAKELVEKYKMKDWDKLARDNETSLDEVRRMFDKKYK